jgi:hypothetical protein
MLTVICKVAYELHPGSAPAVSAEGAIDDSGADEPYAAWQLVPFKPRVDIVVTGHAYAPLGRPVRSLFARVAVGAMSKTVTVYGDRSLLPNGDLSQPAEFQKMPLRWELAAGGPETRNPVGIRARAEMPDGRRPVPNFQPPGIYVASVLDHIPPVGLGPIAPDWPDRQQKLGRRTTAWSHDGWNARPLPDDFDMGYFNVAPPDQQVDAIVPDERITLENLHPEHPRLVTVLAGVVPRATVCRPDRPARAIELRCDTLWIDTDRAVCVVTWRGSIHLAAAAEDGEILITEDDPASLRSSDREPTPVPHSEALDPAVLQTEHAPALPLTLPLVPLPGVMDAARAPVDATVVGLPPPAAAASTLPFAAPGPGVTPVLTPPDGPRVTPVSAGAGTSTVAASLVADSMDLPFGRPGPQEARRPEMQGEPRAFVAPPEPIAEHALPPATAPVEALPPVSAAPLAGSTAGLPSFMRSAQVRAAADSGAPRSFEAQAEPTAFMSAPSIEHDSETPTQRPPALPAPPPMLGPIAMKATTASAPPQADATEAEPAAAEGGSDAPGIDPAMFSIEQCAEIQAELDKQLPRKDVLERRVLAERGWLAVERHWKAALEREASEGGFALRAKHDDAYVRALERLRERPISATEYARVLSAMERRQVAGALREMEMPATAQLPIVRLWTAKLARDPKLSFEMLQALASLRERQGEHDATYAMRSPGGCHVPSSQVV